MQPKNKTRDFYVSGVNLSLLGMIFVFNMVGDEGFEPPTSSV